MEFILNCFSKTPPPGGEKEGPSSAKEGAKAAPAPAPPPPPPKLTYSILTKQDAHTSGVIIRLLSDNDTFTAFSEFEAEDIIARDDEDGVKLQAGVQISIDKGVLPPMDSPPQYLLIDVIGKSPDDICDIIMDDMGAAATEGGVLVLCGLSGTGERLFLNRWRSFSSATAEGIKGGKGPEVPRHTDSPSMFKVS